MFHVIDAAGYAHPLPCSLRPEHWLGSLHPDVHGFTFSSLQVRTDDYRRDAQPLVLSGSISAKTPAELHDLATNLRVWVQGARWLQRSETGAVTRLLEGGDIESRPGKTPLLAELRVVLVQADRRWLDANGKEVSG